MKKYLLIGVVVLFSSNALANTKWNPTGYDKQEVIDEIPALFEKTSNQYPELKGALEPDIGSIQLSLSIPMYLLSSVNMVLANTSNYQRYTLEMDVIDTESGDLLKFECPVNIKYEANFFDIKFSPMVLCPCTLISPEEDERQIFINQSLNPHHEFQV